MKKSIWKRPGFYFSILTFLLAAFLIFELFKLAMLPDIIFLLLAVILFLTWLISAIALIKRPIALGWKILGWILAVTVALTGGVGGYVAYTGNNMLGNISTDEQGQNIVALYVLDNGAIEKESELAGRKVGILKTLSEAAKTAMSDHLQDENITIQTQEYDSVLKMAQDLKDQAIDGMILDPSYIGTLEDMEGMEKISSEIRELIKVSYDAPKAASTASSVDTASTPFTVYISGVDSSGDEIASNSRSDVNLLATVNPQTHEVLLLSIPRDYYVETACDASMGCMQGAMDKLTHTGLHGPETTEMTLEKLFGIDINYNVRVNFTSLIRIVDELGGITVQNPNDFVSTHGNYHFPAGSVDLNGNQALGFVRERYSFTDGDRERGRNEMRVLTALIKKMASPAILSNFAGVMNSLSDSFTTNMPEKDIKALASSQLTNGGEWKIYSYSVTGTGGTDFAAELGDNAYVMYPDEQSVSKAVEDIKAVLAGKEPPYTNDNDTDSAGSETTEQEEAPAEETPAEDPNAYYNEEAVDTFEGY